MGMMADVRENNNTMSDEKTMTQHSRRKGHNRNARRANTAMKGKGLTSRSSNTALSKLDAGRQGSSLSASDLEAGLPPNGQSADAKRNTFVKQESEASSSAATADANLLNDSMITTDDSLLDEQAERSVCADSVNSEQSAQSSSEIKAKGVELICKFYAKQPSDKKKCLLRDVAITDNGEVLITDSRNKNIKVFTLKGEFVRSIEHPELKDPFGISSMSDTNFVVADSKSKDLKVFSMDGKLVNKLGHNLEDYQMKEPRGVAVNSKGEIIVTDSSRRCVYIFQLEGAFCDIIWGEAGLKPLRFKNPAYVGVTDDDDIIVSDYFSKKIALFDAQTHDLKLTYGTKPADKRLRYPRGVATDLDGNILIADNYNGKVHCVNGEQGAFIRFVYGDKHCIHRPRSVACDQIGHLVIIENGGRVRVFDISHMNEAMLPEDEDEQH